VESTGLDLVTMGRGQGPECYCYPNTVLKKFIEGLETGYAAVVMDNEAGLEHLSRKTTEDVDVLLLVSNHTVKGVRAIARIRELVAELRLAVRNQAVIINMAPGGKVDTLVAGEMRALGLAADLVVPEDETVYRFDLEQKPLLTLPDGSAAVTAMDSLMETILKQATATYKQ
jgi:CO dehydrogenase maturation factor